MSSRPQTPSRAQFDAAASSAFLKQGFDAEVSAGPSQDRFYSAPRTTGAGGAWSGGWSTPKGGVTADGKDLLTLLGRSYNDLASKSNSAGAAANAGGKGLKK